MRKRRKIRGRLQGPCMVRQKGNSYFLATKIVIRLRGYLIDK